MADTHYVIFGKINTNQLSFISLLLVIYLLCLVLNILFCQYVPGRRVYANCNLRKIFLNFIRMILCCFVFLCLFAEEIIRYYVFSLNDCLAHFHSLKFLRNPRYCAFEIMYTAASLTHIV